MKAYNKRLDHTAKVSAIDYANNKIELELPESDPLFIYTEKLENTELLEYTGVKLGDVSVYVNDVVVADNKEYKVVKVPGGYYPFMSPVKKSFRIK